MALHHSYPVIASILFLALIFVQVDAVSLSDFGVAQTIKTCQLLTNRRVLLGYNVIGNTPVYQTYCGGLCLSTIIQGSQECRVLAYQKVEIYKPPIWWKFLSPDTSFVSSIGGVSIPYSTTTVVRVSKCGCKPARCVVNGRYYESGSTVYNTCGDKCKCVNGVLTNCCRLRKSFKDMSFTERRRYIQAVYDISKGTGGATPALRSAYNALIADHVTNFGLGIHMPDELLPWHRWYILQLENLLRQIDCRITVPYWKWENDYSNPWGSVIWSGTSDWLGGGSGGSCVPDGPFTTPFYLTPSSGSSTNCLRRMRSGSVPSPSAVASLLATPATSFSTFNSLIDGMHGGVHCSVGATMCSTGSANAPEFFLHHCNMDRLWAKWQDQGLAYKYAFVAGINNTMTATSLAAPYKPWDVMDIYNHLGVCVRYVEPGIISLSDVLVALPASVLASIPKVKPTWINNAVEWWKAMAMDDDDIQKSLDNLQDYFSNSPELIDAQDDPFVQNYGMRRSDLEDALNGWETVATSEDLKTLTSVRSALENFDDQTASNDFQQTTASSIIKTTNRNACIVNDNGICN